MFPRQTLSGVRSAQLRAIKPEGQTSRPLSLTRRELEPLTL